MALDRAAVGRVARLARIRIPDDEVERLAQELSAILDWIDKLGEVDVSGVEPMTAVVDSDLPAREVADGHFVVPKVIE